jgi:hypothetical protein
MADERSYVAANTRQRERLRALVEGLDDDALTAPVNEYWTVAGVLGHIAYWDIRVLVLAEKIDRGELWAPGDAEPEGDWLNDSTRPLIHAIAPREAAQLAFVSPRKPTRAWRTCPWTGFGPATPTARSTRPAASIAASTSTRSRPPSKVRGNATFRRTAAGSRASPPGGCVTRDTPARRYV